MDKNVKKITKTIIVSFLSFSMLFVNLLNVSASDVPIHPDSQVETISLESETPSISTRAVTDGVRTWKVESKTANGYSYGAWKNGPVGKGKSTLSMNITKGSSIMVTNTISGSYTTVGTISAALGVTINKSISYSASYSVPVPAGKTYKIQYRPYFKQIKVVQRAYTRLDGKEYKTSETKTCYVNVFQNWSYRYIVQ